MDKLFEKILESEGYRLEKIHKVPINTIRYYIDYWCRNILEDDRILLYGYDDESGIFIGIDNTSNDCWVEEFDNEDDCIKWLKKEIDK